MEQLQLVFVPSPGKGHLVSTIEFAKLLLNHDHRLFITVLIIRSPIDVDLDAYTHSLASSQRLQLTILPTNLPTISESVCLCDLFEALVENQKPHVREAVSTLNSSPDSPRIAGFIVDMFCTPMIDVANEFGVPSMVFYTSGAAYLGFVLHFHTLRERDNVDATAFNFKDSGIEFSVPSYVNPVPARVLPHVVLEKEWESFFSRVYAGGLKKAKGIIVNTFEELESHAVHSFSKGDISIYPVGPILSLKDNTDKPVSVQQGSHVIKWLDDQPRSSVIFLCFGSRGYFDQENQVREIARALENSGVRFLWSLRKPPPEGSVESPSDYSNLADVLPKGFLERTAEVGRVIGWAPQAQILAHQAVGGFVSHCGWNSILESIYFGVPIATWPLGAEQQMNAFELVRELGIAVEISLDYRIKFTNGSKTEILSAERIKKGIKDVMVKENETRKKMKGMSEKSRKALVQGGSSYSSLDRLILDLTKMF